MYSAQGSYSSVEKLFQAMALVFLAYPIAAILARPDWVAVAHSAFGTPSPSSP